MTIMEQPNDDAVMPVEPTAVVELAPETAPVVAGVDPLLVLVNRMDGMESALISLQGLLGKMQIEYGREVDEVNTRMFNLEQIVKRVFK